MNAENKKTLPVDWKQNFEPSVATEDAQRIVARKIKKAVAQTTA